MAAGGAVLLAAAALALPPVRGWFADPEGTPVQPAEAEPAAWPPRDLASRDGFLADQPMPGCALAERIASGPDTGVIAVLSASPVDTGPLLEGYAQAFGSRPDITQRRVAPGQCAALELMRELAGRGVAAPRIDAVAQRGADGLAVQARVSSAAGSGAGALWIALIAPDGAVYDVTAWAQPQPDGSVRVEATAADPPTGSAGDAPAYLLLALASDQPLAAVAAATAGAQAASLLPAALAELRGQTAAAGTLIALDPVAPEPVVQAAEMRADEAQAAEMPGDETQVGEMRADEAQAAEAQAAEMQLGASPSDLSPAALPSAAPSAAPPTAPADDTLPPAALTPASVDPRTLLPLAPG